MGVSTFDRWSVRAMALLVATGVVVASMVLPAGPESSAAAAGASVECVTEAFDEAGAMAAAAVCDHEVEVLDRRTPWDTVHALPNGSMRLDVSAGAVRTDVTGVWTEIDTTLVEGPDGVTVAAPAIAMTFSDGGPGAPLARLVRDGHELTFDVPFDLPEPVLHARTIEYGEVLPGVDLLVSVHEDGSGFSEVLRVESPEAAADPRLAALTFPVTVSDGLDLTEREGGFVASDSEGEAVFRSPVPLMWDSSADRASADRAGTSAGLRASAATTALEAVVNGASRVEGPVEGDKVASMPVVLGDGAVEVAPDAEFLAADDISWPVYIDPSVTAGLADWTSVTSNGWIHYTYAGDEGVGRCNSSAMGCTAVFTQRSMWEYGGLGTIGGLDAANVHKATFRVFGSHSYSCTATPVEAWRVGGFTRNTGWPGVWYTRLQTLSVAHKPSCGNAGWITFDVTAAAQWVADANANAVAIGLKATDESTMAGWKRYRYDAVLSVTYNRPPAKPKGLRTTTPVSTCSTTTPTWFNSGRPTFHATLTDPDAGAMVRTHFEVRRISNGAQVWGPKVTSPQTSGSSHSVRVGSTEVLSDGSYRWVALGIDQGNRVGESVSCLFGVDTVKPNAPTVVPVANGSVEYPEDGWGGGVGKKGKFKPKSSSGDVVSFKYSFNDTALGDTVLKDHLIEFPAEKAGPQVLYVVAVDRAGNTSARTMYRFSVEFAASDGRWELDDGTGLTATNSTKADNPLRLTRAEMWGRGPLYDFTGNGDDWALRFATPSDVASSVEPVVLTDQSFAVAAFVKLDSLLGTATAVSQDGTTTSGFDLGYRTDGCPASMSGCWAFSMSRKDASGPLSVIASDVPVRTGSWVHLLGVHDAVNDEIGLYVCEIGPADAPVEGAEPRDAGVVPHVGDWRSRGALRIGQGRAASAAARHWLGTVDSVQIWDGLDDIEQIRRRCLPQV